MYEKLAIPFVDGRATCRGLRYERGQFIDRVHAPLGVPYRFDLREVFDSTITYVAVTCGPGRVGDLRDRSFLYLYDGTIDGSCGPYGNDYGQGFGERKARVDISAYSEVGEHFTARLMIEEMRPDCISVAGPRVDCDGFLLDGCGTKITNSHGWWLRFARGLRRVETLAYVDYDITANGAPIGLGGDAFLVYEPRAEIRGGDSLKQCVFRNKAELDKYLVEHGAEECSGAIMAGETGEIVRK